MKRFSKKWSFVDNSSAGEYLVRASSVRNIGTIKNNFSKNYQYSKSEFSKKYQYSKNKFQ